MMIRINRLIALLSVSALVMAACGTPAAPAYLPTSTSPANASSSIVDSSGVAAQPTATDIPATETPVPPTATPTEEPTEEPTPEPTDEPAAEPTEETVDAEAADSESTDSEATDGEATGPIDEAREADIEFFLGLASASEGDALFHENLALPDGAMWACATCHNVNENLDGVGPSLIGINERAGSRVEGQGPLTYMYNSIYDSQAFIVPGFEDNALHMPIYGESGVLTDQQIYNLIAYLRTLPSE